MNFLKRFTNAGATPSNEEQAVLIYFPNEDLEASIPLQNRLYRLLQDERLGVFDGNEVGGGELVLYMYGPNAEALFKYVEPALRADKFCKGARAIIRSGGHSAPQQEVIL